MVYRYAIDAPFREQWEPSSRLPPPDPGLAPGNCGVTCVTMTAVYYRDTPFGIYATRRLGTTDKELSTSITEQQLMLRRRGVPCHFERMTVATIAARVGTGRWPVMVGLQMSLVPLAVAGHPFRGSHALLLRARVTRNGVHGFLAADPNFSSRTNRRDPTNGRRFYSDALIKRAYYDAGMFALVPDKPKGLIAPKPPSGGTILADGDPAPMRYRTLVNQDTGALPLRTVKKGKPVRKGALTTSPTWTTVTGPTVIRPFGRIDSSDLAVGERQYGDVYLANWYSGNGEHIGYIKQVDLQ